MIAGQSGIAGSTTLGNNVFVGGKHCKNRKINLQDKAV
jgi:UDP-3-O-[3-hydroxymyristoyl] glucosamine N-acyltransferase